jgi:3-methyl-2-oxobutanoate hydroxymethyltransferase
MGCIPISGSGTGGNMSVAPRMGDGKVTVPGILSRKSSSHASSSIQPKSKITCLTAYDFPTARLLDDAGVDILLVGDSVGMVALGYDNTLPVTIDEILHHTRAVRRGTKRALLVADMPYGSFHVAIEESVRNAVRLIKEGGAEAVKVEGGERRLELIARLVEAEIPVMAHVGLTPQSIHALGGFHVQGKTAEAARQLERDARAVESAGAFSVVLESVPSDLSARITERLRIPTIGIGAGPECDGQILVLHDLLGLTQGHKPKFARQYVDLSVQISQAVTSYCADVRSGDFPSEAESFRSTNELRDYLRGPALVKQRV